MEQRLDRVKSEAGVGNLLLANSIVIYSIYRSTINTSETLIYKGMFAAG